MQFSDTPAFWEKYAHTLAEYGRVVANVIQEHLGSAGAQMITAQAESGDIQTKADHAAGEALEMVLSRSPIPLALLDENTGTLRNLAENPVIGIIADELDGTRPARMGMATCCVSLAAWPLSCDAVLSNVRAGAIVPLDGTPEWSFASGVALFRDMKSVTKPRSITMPARELRSFIDMGIVDPTILSLYTRGLANDLHGCARMCSLCYGVIRLLEGDVDVVLDLGARISKEWPALQPVLEQRWGELSGTQPYDVAAAIPMLWEAGYEVTDAFGEERFETMRLDGTNQDDAVPGLIAAENMETWLHVKSVMAANEIEAKKFEGPLTDLLVNH